MLQRTEQLLVRVWCRPSRCAGGATERVAFHCISQRVGGRHLWPRHMADSVIDRGRTANNCCSSAELVELCAAAGRHCEQRPGHHPHEYRRNCAGCRIRLSGFELRRDRQLRQCRGERRSHLFDQSDVFLRIKPARVVGQVVINANVAGGQIAIPASGIGSAAGLVTASPSTLSFGKVQIGTTSASLPVTLENAGSIAFSVANISVTPPFNLSANACGSSLGANSACALGVTITPTQTGPVTGTLTITDDAGHTNSRVERNRCSSANGRAVAFFNRLRSDHRRASVDSAGRYAIE